MSETTNTPEPAKPTEYQNFEAGLKSILRVSKKDVDTELAKEKQQKQSAQEPRQS